MGTWYLYLIECRGGSVYTGISTDVARRYAQHEAGTGARYTRSRPPLRLLAQFAFADRAAASRAEHAVKQLAPADKRRLAQGATLDPFLVPASAQALHATESTQAAKRVRASHDGDDRTSE